MGQYWVILDIDGEKNLATLGKLGESLFSIGDSLILPLSRPVPSREPSVKALIKPYQRSSQGLFKLPLEILCRILKALGAISRSDLLAFVMVNRTLYTIGFEYFQAAMCQYEVPCAGHRLVCLGDYSRDDDLPPGFLPSDIEKVSAAWGQYAGEEEDPQFYTYAVHRFPEVSYFETSTYAWKRKWVKHDDYHFGGYKEPRAKKPRARKPRALEDKALDDLLDQHRGHGWQWALCNLTKRVYVTADAVSKFQETISYGPFFVGMGKVLLSQICWSSDDSMSLSYDGPVHRGKWAGDRFEYTTLERLPDLKPVEGGEKGEWEDVSDEVIGEVAAIFRAEFGDGYPCDD